MLSAGSDPRRNRAFAALAVLTLLLHALLLGGVDLAPSRPGEPAGAALQVRTIAAPVPAEPEPAPPPPMAAATPAPPRPVRPPARPVAMPVAAPVSRGDDPSERHAPPSEPELHPPPLESAAAPRMPAASEVAALQPSSAATPASVPASAPAPAGEGAPPPLYATQLPPPATLRYELRRGRLAGSGDGWQVEAGRYALRLEGSVVGLNVLTQVSEGNLDAHGLAPTRFTDQRARRAAVAANFEREAGRIRFSGPSTEVPWQPGVQDRLSWMMQLAAVVAADPALLAEGQRISLQVVGARGDASMWSFRSLGKEALTTFGVTVDTVHLLREPRSPYDTRVEVWLDPARHHLPVRATLGTGDEDRLELRLREFIPGG